ncbi:MAG: hypothetical protein OXS35_09665 [Dehalococcoidia bacterium]|nr:hypothetical protein [Dehalococcoidia bacterium]
MYFGQIADLSEPLEGHPATACAVMRGATHLGAYAPNMGLGDDRLDREQVRLEIVADLLVRHNALCSQLG